MAASSEFETGYHLSLSNVVRIPWGWGVGKLVGNTQSSVSSESRELSIPFLKQIWSLFLTETWNSPLLCCHHPIARHSSTLCDTCVGEHLLLSPLSDPQHPSWQSSLSVQARWPTYPVCFLPGHWRLFISRLFPSLPCWFWDHPHQSSSSFISDTILGFLSVCQTSNSTMYSNSWAVSSSFSPRLDVTPTSYSLITAFCPYVTSLSTFGPHLCSWLLITPFSHMLSASLWHFSRAQGLCRDMNHSL